MSRLCLGVSLTIVSDLPGNDCQDLPSPLLSRHSDLCAQRAAGLHEKSGCNCFIDSVQVFEEKSPKQSEGDLPCVIRIYLPLPSVESLSQFESSPPWCGDLFFIFIFGFSDLSFLL